MLALLPRYLEKDGVVAVGEIGFDDQTAAEDSVLRARRSSWRARFELPVLDPHAAPRQEARHRAHASRWCATLGFPEERVLIDHNNEETLPLVLDTGCWAGHSIYPNTKMDEPRMAALVKKYGTERIIVNSAADWGVSDPLKVPKTVARDARSSGIADDATSRRSSGTTRSRSSPRAAGSTSRRSSDARPSISAQLFEGNSVLRGQAPVERRAEPAPLRCTPPWSSTSSGSTPRQLLGRRDTPHLARARARRARCAPLRDDHCRR